MIMKRQDSFLAMGLLLAAFGAAPLAPAADITGKVTLTGTPPAEIPIPLDANCCKVQPKAITTRHYIVGQDHGLGNVFVWIKEGVNKKYSPPATLAELDQAGCEYVPYMQGMVAGQKLKILNSDPFLHNVNCMPAVNKGFNLAQVTKGQTSERTFDKQEVFVKFKCDVHPWMFAYIGVVEHPFFCVTDQNGKYTIPNLPAGKYTLEAYHLKAGKIQQEVTVTEEEKKVVDFTLAVPAPK
jgi:hypothetical protein